MEVVDNLNEEQARAVQIVESGRNLFLTGPAGAGKTHTLKTIVRAVVARGKTVHVTAATGVAASLLQGVSDNGARTLHSWVAIGLGLEKIEYYVSKINRYRPTRDRLMRTDLLIVDECSMLAREYVEKVDAILRRVRGRMAEPFGGIQLVLCGDFFQLGPVQKSPILLFDTPIWSTMVHESVVLTRIYRQTSDLFVSVLAKVRVGTVDESVISAIRGTASNRLENDLGIKPTVLFCKNRDVDTMNRIELETLDTEEHVFPAIEKNLPTVASWLPFSLPAQLTLKIGAQVMMLANDDPERGIVNGARGIVVAIHKRSAVMPDRVLVRFLSGEEVMITRRTQDYDVDGTGVVAGKPLKASRTQFPLKLAWAITIHKSQGSSIDYLIVNLDGCFTYGQAYTALSRGTRLENMVVQNFNVRSVMANLRVIDFDSSLQRNSSSSSKRPREDGPRILSQFFKKIC
jgi:ATP-dependent DNA helicase PIF1